MASHADLLLRAEYGFVEFQLQVLAEIGSALSSAAPPSPLTEHVAKTKNVAENVTEILENRRIESCRTSRVAANARMTEAVIQRSLVAVGENRVRFRNFLELLFRVGIVRVAVGMLGHRELAVCALDFHFG